MEFTDAVGVEYDGSQVPPEWYGIYRMSFYPPLKAAGYRFGVVRPDVRPSQTYWGYILKTITDLSMKLQRFMDLIEEKFTAHKL